MGQAKRRGTKSKRQELAIKRDNEELRERYLKWKALEDAKSPEQKTRERADLVERARRRMELICMIQTV